MPQFGTVELVMDKKHHLKVSTMQATVLLVLENHQGVDIEELTQLMQHPDINVLKKILDGLTLANILIQKDSRFMLRDAKDVKDADIN